MVAAHTILHNYISLGGLRACDASLSWELEVRSPKSAYELNFKITYRLILVLVSMLNSEDICRKICPPRYCQVIIALIGAYI